MSNQVHRDRNDPNQQKHVTSLFSATAILFCKIVVRVSAKFPCMLRTAQKLLCIYNAKIPHVMLIINLFRWK